VSWVDPQWLVVAGLALSLLPAALALTRWRRLQQARVGTRGLWMRWLGGVPATGGARLTLWLLAAAAAAVAAAGPRWGRPEPLPWQGLDVVIALDVSDSMQCSDVPPSRLQRATAVVRQTVDRFPDANWGLVVGAGDARALVPLTQDREALLRTLADPELERWVTPGSNLAVLLATAGSLLPGGGPGRVVLVVSDGEELEGDAVAAADALRRGGVVIVPLISGTPGGAPVPRPDARGGVTYARDSVGALVRSRARPEVMGRLGGGTERSTDALQAAAAQELAQALARGASTSEREAAPIHRAPFMAGAAVLATLSFLLWPWRRASRAALAALLLPVPLAAAPPTAPTPSAWERVLPGSARLLERRAAEAAARGAWEEARQAYARAVALRPADDVLRLGLATAQAYEADPEGERTLAELAASEPLAYAAWYNLGTARLMHGNAAGAVEALRRAVASSPGQTDAWHNLELAQADVARESGRPSAPSSAESREQLVDAAARNALEPLAPREQPRRDGRPGRDW
jgi:Ca-activated chloride channel family protein